MKKPGIAMERQSCSCKSDGRREGAALYYHLHLH